MLRFIEDPNDVGWYEDDSIPSEHDPERGKFICLGGEDHQAIYYVKRKFLEKKVLLDFPVLLGKAAGEHFRKACFNG